MHVYTVLSYVAAVRSTKIRDMSIFVQRSPHLFFIGMEDHGNGSKTHTHMSDSSGTRLMDNSFFAIEWGFGWDLMWCVPLRDLRALRRPCDFFGGWPTSSRAISIPPPVRLFINMLLVFMNGCSQTCDHTVHLYLYPHLICTWTPSVYKLLPSLYTTPAFYEQRAAGLRRLDYTIERWMDGMAKTRNKRQATKETRQDWRKL